ncbi:MAG: hypothetical protein U0T77_10870 [Chitinophagales bacterium]
MIPLSLTQTREEREYRCRTDRGKSANRPAQVLWFIPKRLFHYQAGMIDTGFIRPANIDASWYGMLDGAPCWRRQCTGRPDIA